MAFISTCPEVWGGSEELWSEACLHMNLEGHKTLAIKYNINWAHSRIQTLAETGSTVLDSKNMRFSLPFRLLNRFLPYPYYYEESRARVILIERKLTLFQPDLVVISQGENMDGIEIGAMCLASGFPYVLIAQKAVEYSWLHDAFRETAQKTYHHALASYFVSKHNRRLTEQQLGQSLQNAFVVSNPFKTKISERLPWPKDSATLRLACIARFFLLDKAQDMLVRVLSQSKWKERNLEVSFYGTGIHEEGVKELAQHLGVKNVFFKGYVEDIVALWENHHALVLPTRSEGMPLVVLEAMRCGRPVIATPAGGIPEIIQHQKNGFLATSIDENALDETLEIAWQHKANWEQLGIQAHTDINSTIPADPSKAFSEQLLTLLHETQSN